MRYVLLTWNPGPGDDERYTPDEWFDAMVLPLQEGRQPDGYRWSIGTNWNRIITGDLVCMYRQGVHGRGIVATGVITGGAFLDSHWNPDKAGDAWYVNVAWNQALDLTQMITVDELKHQVSDFAWDNVYASGHIVDGSAAEQLACLLGQGPPLTAQGEGGQQFAAAERRQQVELEAMECVSAGYRAERYEVTDVSRQNLGWDLEARRNGEMVYIEVKGTTGLHPEFFLTANEHRAATDQEGWVAVVITDIFGAEPSWYEFSGLDVAAAARPTQYRVTLGP